MAICRYFVLLKDRTMRFIWLESDTLSPVIAKSRYNKRKGCYIYTVGIGDGKNKICWEYILQMSTRYPHQPISEHDKLELNKNYDLIPIINKNKQHQKDYLNNYSYYIEEIENNPNNNDMLLFWVLPLGYREVKTRFYGNYNLIGKGSNARTRNGVCYKTPCFAIELTGDTVLVWEGYDQSNALMYQEVRYIWREKRFEIGNIKLKG